MHSLLLSSTQPCTNSFGNDSQTDGQLCNNQTNISQPAVAQLLHAEDCAQSTAKLLRCVRDWLEEESSAATDQIKALNKHYRLQLFLRDTHIETLQEEIKSLKGPSINKNKQKVNIDDELSECIEEEDQQSSRTDNNVSSKGKAFDDAVLEQNKCRDYFTMDNGLSATLPQRFIPRSIETANLRASDEFQASTQRNLIDQGHIYPAKGLPYHSYPYGAAPNGKQNRKVYIETGVQYEQPMLQSNLALRKSKIMLLKTDIRERISLKLSLQESLKVFAAKRESIEQELQQNSRSNSQLDNQPYRPSLNFEAQSQLLAHASRPNNPNDLNNILSEEIDFSGTQTDKGFIKTCSTTAIDFSETSNTKDAFMRSDLNKMSKDIVLQAQIGQTFKAQLANTYTNQFETYRMTNSNHISSNSSSKSNGQNPLTSKQKQTDSMDTHYDSIKCNQQTEDLKISRIFSRVMPMSSSQRKMTESRSKDSKQRALTKQQSDIIKENSHEKQVMSEYNFGVNMLKCSQKVNNPQEKGNANTQFYRNPLLRTQTPSRLSDSKPKQSTRSKNKAFRQIETNQMKESPMKTLQANYNARDLARRTSELQKDKAIEKSNRISREKNILQSQKSSLRVDASNQGFNI